MYSTPQPHTAGPAALPMAKWRRVLVRLLRGDSLDRFTAERELKDHVLPSTVSELQGKGLRIERELVKLPGYQGEPVHCAKYWLSPDSFERARELLGLEKQQAPT